MTSDDWPEEIRLKKGRKILEVRFGGGQVFGLPAELLRVMSPSAEVQGHSADQKQTVPGKRNVEILKVEPVGNYAVRLSFDDLHNTGIYSWTYLHKMGVEQDTMWAEYEADLAAKGLRRDP